MRLSASQRLSQNTQATVKIGGQRKWTETYPVNGASSRTIARAREETYDEHAIAAKTICRWPDHRGAHKRRNRPARRKARQSGLPYLLRSQCAGRVRPRRRHAAFILVPDRPPDVRRDSKAGPQLRYGILGCGDGPPRQHPGSYANAGRLAGGLGRARKSAGGGGEDAARAGLDRGAERLFPRP